MAGKNLGMPSMQDKNSKELNLPDEQRGQKRSPKRTQLVLMGFKE
jgi:hypothetical protein